MVAMFDNDVPFEAIIFDLDGTLLDTLDDIADAANAVLRREGMPTHPVDAYRYFVGDGVRQLVWRSLPENTRSDVTVDRIQTAYRDEYARSWNVKTKPFDGIADMLDAATERGVKLAVLSNKPEDFVKLCVDAHFSQWPIAPVLGDHPSRARKPDPAAALSIADTFGTQPKRMLFVGDSSIDMETANAAGMFAVGVPWGFRTRAELAGAGARKILNEPKDLIELI